MMTTVPIILVIVVWLFILAPWLLRSQRPMSHTGEAFEETRVLFEGDSGSVLGRRKPRLGKDDVRPSSYSSADDADADYELVIADDPAADSSRSAESSRGEAEDADTVAATIDGEVVEAATEFEDGIDSDAGTDGAENAQAVPASAAQADAKADLEDEDDDDDDDDDDDEEEECYATTCPTCEETIYFDESVLEDGEVVCPNCGEKLEFDLGGLEDEEPSDDQE